MGYTHYWTINTKGEQKEWSDALVVAAPIIHNAYPFLVRDQGGGDGAPQFTDKFVCFNGIGTMSHEAFVMPTVLSEVEWQPWQNKASGEYMDFCKTARKPYDVVVAAVLATLEYCAPGVISVQSDGNPTDWVEGVKLARKSTGIDDIPIPHDVLALRSIQERYREEYAGDVASAIEQLAS